VADVLTRHGIWEFGRFAGRYYRHFGELPSQTLSRARA
jgi:AraC family ethanolamine operon transcriptional activator